MDVLSALEDIENEFPTESNESQLNERKSDSEKWEERIQDIHLQMISYFSPFYDISLIKLFRESIKEDEKKFNEFQTATSLLEKILQNWQTNQKIIDNQQAVVSQLRSELRVQSIINAKSAEGIDELEREIAQLTANNIKNAEKIAQITKSKKEKEVELAKKISHLTGRETSLLHEIKKKELEIETLKTKLMSINQSNQSSLSSSSSTSSSQSTKKVVTLSSKSSSSTSKVVSRSASNKSSKDLPIVVVDLPKKKPLLENLNYNAEKENETILRNYEEKINKFQMDNLSLMNTIKFFDRELHDSLCLCSPLYSLTPPEGEICNDINKVDQITKRIRYKFQNLKELLSSVNQNDQTTPLDFDELLSTINQKDQISPINSLSSLSLNNLINIEKNECENELKQYQNDVISSSHHLSTDILDHSNNDNNNFHENNNENDNNCDRSNLNAKEEIAQQYLELNEENNNGDDNNCNNYTDNEDKKEVKKNEEVDNHSDNANIHIAFDNLNIDKVSKEENEIIDDYNNYQDDVNNCLNQENEERYEREGDIEVKEEEGRDVEEEQQEEEGGDVEEVGDDDDRVRDLIGSSEEGDELDLIDQYKNIMFDLQSRVTNLNSSANTFVTAHQYI